MNEGTCAWAADRLPELAAGTLSAEDEATLRAHLDACADCRAELAVVEGVRGARAAAPPELRGRILGALELPATPERPAALDRTATLDSAAARGRSAAPASRSWRPSLPKVTLLAAAALAVLVTAGVLLRGGGGPEAELLADASVEAPEIAALPGEDGVLAGAAVLSDLSEEELEMLLEELET